MVTYYSCFSAPSSFPRNLHLETISYIESFLIPQESCQLFHGMMSSIGHLGCFQSFAVINNAAINNSINRSFLIFESISDNIQEVKLLG